MIWRWCCRYDILYLLYQNEFFFKIFLSSMYRCLRSICINLYQYVSTFDVNFLPNVRQCWMFTMTLRALAALYKRRQFHRRDSLKSNWHNFLHQNCVSVRRDDRNSKCLTDFILLVPPNPKKNHQEIQGISQRNSKWQIGPYCCRHAHRFRIQKNKKQKSDINYDLASIKHLSSPRAESARAVTGRRCPHSGVG